MAPFICAYLGEIRTCQIYISKYRQKDRERYKKEKKKKQIEKRKREGYKKEKPLTVIEGEMYAFSVASPYL